jgi:hypothetical protein
MYAPAQLAELMSVSDYVLVATPYTPATHQLVNAAAIAAMKPNGVIVNVGRGKCIDEAALIEGEELLVLPAGAPCTACSASAGVTYRDRVCCLMMTLHRDAVVHCTALSAYLVLCLVDTQGLLHAM